VNRHFGSATHEYSDGIPTRAYARVDSVDEGDDGQIIIGLDAVSTRSADSLLERLPADEWTDAWAGVLRGGRDVDWGDLLEMFDGLELYQIEVSTSPRRAAELLQARDPSDPAGGWLLLAMSPDRGDGLPATVFPGLFAPGQPASVVETGAPPPPTQSMLAAAFSMRSWPIASDHDLERELRKGKASTWAAYDVGQGSANGLLDQVGRVHLLHDIGCGVYSNAKTRPRDLVLCSSVEAPIVLSHWDTDHWGGARYFAPKSDQDAFLRRSWIVPLDLTIGPRHMAFAASILAAGGRLYVMAAGPWQSKWVTMLDGRNIRLLRGDGKDRNGSGMAMEIHDVRNSGGRWLLTGDVDYQFLQAHLAPKYVAISVPHHGAKSASTGRIPSPSPNYSRLVYSFGHDNTFGHPKSACMSAHMVAGWDHGYWMPKLDATVVAKGEVVATACNRPGPSHLESISIGWTSPPPAPCAPGCKWVQCNASVGQN